MSQQNQITGVHWQYFPCVQGDHKPYCASCLVHATGKGFPCSSDNNCVWGYPHVSVFPGQQPLFQFLQNFIEIQLYSSLYSFTLQPPTIVDLTKSWDFLLTLLLPRLSTAQGKSQLGAVQTTMGLISIPLSEYDLSMKKLALPSHTLLAFIFSSHFSGKFFVLVWFCFAFLFLTFKLTDVSVYLIIFNEPFSPCTHIISQ